MSEGTPGDERPDASGEQPQQQPPPQPESPQPDGRVGSGPEPGPDGPGRRGRMSFQDESTAPREPTLGEQRARQQAERRRLEEASAKHTADLARNKKRKRILIGTGVTVGVVAVIAIGYAIANAGDDVEARCVDASGVVVDDNNCVTPASAGGNYNNGGYYGGGLYPIFIGAGGGQYHYNYGGSGGVGQVASGGTTVVPKDSSTVKSGTSGKTISRGGLGVSSSSGGKGSSSGGSSSGS